MPRDSATFPRSSAVLGRWAGQMLGRRQGWILLIGGVALLATGCTSSEPDAADAAGGAATSAPPGPAQLAAEGILTVCVDAPKYPFAFQSGGEWLGFDIEVVQHIAEELDLTLAVTDVPFDGIWRLPAAGDCDLAAAAITVTDARTEATFTQSYLDAAQSVLVRKDDEMIYAFLADLEGRPIGVKGATTSEAYLQANLPVSATVVTFEDTEAMFLALGAREVDAVVSDLPLNGYRSTLDSAVAITEVIETGEIYGFAAASTNAGLVADIDEILADYLESDEYRSLLARWFGVR